MVDILLLKVDFKQLFDNKNNLNVRDSNRYHSSGSQNNNYVQGSAYMSQKNGKNRLE